MPGMPTPKEIAKLISEDIDFGGPPAPEPDMGMEPGEPGDEMVPGAEEQGMVETPITMSKGLLSKLFDYVNMIPEGEGAAEEIMYLADSVEEHSEVEGMPGVPGEEGEGQIMTDEDYDEIMRLVDEKKGVGGIEGEEGEEVAEMPGAEETGGDMEGGGPPFESSEKPDNTISEQREKFRKIN